MPTSDRRLIDAWDRLATGEAAAGGRFVKAFDAVCRTCALPGASGASEDRHAVDEARAALLYRDLVLHLGWSAVHAPYAKAVPDALGPAMRALYLVVEAGVRALLHTAPRPAADAARSLLRRLPALPHAPGDPAQAPGAVRSDKLDAAAARREFPARLRRARDAKAARADGAFFTPGPVVEALVARVWQRLGGSDLPAPLVYEPAVGSGTFLVSWLARSPSLRRVVGVERDPLSFVVAHWELADLLASGGARAIREARVGMARDAELPVYLGDTLVRASDATWRPPFPSALAEDPGVPRVALGNPPFGRLPLGAPSPPSLEAYRVRGERKQNLRRLEWAFTAHLHDWLTRGRPATAVGGLALVLNRSLIHAPTLRGLRDRLAADFAPLELLDLGGDRRDDDPSAVGDSGRAGVRDGNVFGIAHGTVLVVGARGGPGASGQLQEGQGQITIRSLGRLSSAAKLGAIQQAFATTVDRAPCLGEGVDVAGRVDRPGVGPARRGGGGRWEDWPSLADLMPYRSSGIQTKRDRLMVARTPGELLDRLRRLLDQAAREGVEAARTALGVGPDTSGWALGPAIEAIRADGGVRADRVLPMLYRPFDSRVVYAVGGDPRVLGRPRGALLARWLGDDPTRWGARARAAPVECEWDGVALVVNRQTTGPRWSHVLATRIPCCHGTLYLGNRGQDYAFPVFDARRAGMTDEGRRSVNVDPAIAARLCPPGATVVDGHGGEQAEGRGGALPLTSFVCYALGVLHIPAYRERYAGALRDGFPRLPCPPSMAVAEQVRDLGTRLLRVYLNEDANEAAGGRGGDAGRGSAWHVRDEDGAVRLGQGACVAVAQADWELEVGGYRPIDAWLRRARRERLAVTDASLAALRGLIGQVQALRAALAQADDIPRDWL